MYKLKLFCLPIIAPCRPYLSNSLPNRFGGGRSSSSCCCAISVVIRYYSQNTSHSPQAVGDSLIPTINKLQEIFGLAGMNLDLPQIVVVGGQSSGKSSVLESLVGRDFLPRGNDIVTRRPLILQLQQTPIPPLPTTPTTLEYGEFSHLPNRKFQNFQEIKKEIEAETNRVAGTNRNISDLPIILKVYSPYVLDLTLVDTPGIARVPSGDQPKNIEEQVRKLVISYISKPNSIILAVQAANQDLATSDALSLAKSVDSEGSRTVGVLTKLDLMDQGTDAVAILLGRQFPLRRGWIAVINRSQSDINKDIPIKDAQQNEIKYFTTHPIYNSIADRCGSKVLAYKCNKLLTEHIRKTIPQLRKHIELQIQKRQTELESYGNPISADDNHAAGWTLLQFLNKFTDQYRETITSGHISTDIDFAGKVELSGGARIRYIVNDIFTKKLNEVHPTAGLTTIDILATIQNASGSKQSIFVPENAFEALIVRQLKWLREPSVQIAELVHDELLTILRELENKEMIRFSRLKDRVEEEARDILRKMLKETKRNIHTAIDVEMSYINMAHPDFIGPKILHSKEIGEYKKDVIENENTKGGGIGGFFSFLFGAKEKKVTIQGKKDNFEDIFQNIEEREKTQISIMRQLLDSYFDIAKKNIQDRVTKLIMHFLVLNSINRLHAKLHVTLYNQSNLKEITELLSEAEDISLKRKICSQELEAFLNAKKILAQINDSI